MKREIKFRAWDVANEIMIYTGHFSFEQFGESGLRPNIDKQYVAPMEGIESGEMVTLDSLHAFHLMQYTGLKDKHDKEIYEGDIIKIASTGDIKKIFYHKCSFGIDLGNNVFAPIYWHEDIEVIGNIYENPELN